MSRTRNLPGPAGCRERAILSSLVALRLPAAPSVKTLHTAFTIDERTGSLRERRDRQDYVRVVERTVAIDGARNHGLRCLQRLRSRSRISKVVVGLDVPQHICFSRLRDHFERIQTAVPRICTDYIAADGIRSLGQYTHRRAGRFGDPLCPRAKLRCLWMLCRGVTEQDSLSFACHQRRCNRLGSITGSNAVDWRALAALARDCNRDLAQCLNPLARSHDACLPPASADRYRRRATRCKPRLVAARSRADSSG